eukprot:bmy_05734T0
MWPTAAWLTTCRPAFPFSQTQAASGVMRHRGAEGPLADSVARGKGPLLYPGSSLSALRVYAKNDSHHQQQSMFLVPTDTLGIKIIQSLTVYGLEDAPGWPSRGGSPLCVGLGLSLQKRLWAALAPAQGVTPVRGTAPSLPSCLLCPQAKSRVAFAKPLVEQGTVLADIAQSRMEIEQARLLAAGLDIAMIKMVAPSMANRVIDHSILAFRAAELSNNYPLAQFFTWARALHFALMRYTGRQWPRQS